MSAQIIWTMAFNHIMVIWPCWGSLQDHRNCSHLAVSTYYFLLCPVFHPLFHTISPSLVAGNPWIQRHVLLSYAACDFQFVIISLWVSCQCDIQGQVSIFSLSILSTEPLLSPSLSKPLCNWNLHQVWWLQSKSDAIHLEIWCKKEALYCTLSSTDLEWIPQSVITRCRVKLPEWPKGPKTDLERDSGLIAQGRLMIAPNSVCTIFSYRTLHGLLEVR